MKNLRFAGQFLFVKTPLHLFKFLDAFGYFSGLPTFFLIFYVTSNTAHFFLASSSFVIIASEIALVFLPIIETLVMNTSDTTRSKGLCNWRCGLE